MPVEIGWIEPTRTLRLAGELDVLSAPDVTSFLEGQEQGDGDLVFDLSGLSFVDSSGVRALIRAADSLAGRGRLVLRSPTSTVWRVFDLMGLIGTSPHLVVEGSGWQPRPDEETRSYPAETSALVEARRFIRTRALADAYGEWAENLVLAVSEACSNAVLHSGTAEVRVTWRVLADRVEVEVRDTGIFRRALPPDRAGTNSRGILLMMVMMDQITITCGTESRPGTVVRMVKMKNGRHSSASEERAAAGRMPSSRSRVAS